VQTTFGIFKMATIAMETGVGQTFGRRKKEEEE
jgi:hypothetical protein